MYYIFFFSSYLYGWINIYSPGSMCLAISGWGGAGVWGVTQRWPSCLGTDSAVSPSPMASLCQHQEPEDPEMAA